MVYPLKDLERLGEDAMAPCVVCHRQLLETGLPVFFRIEAKQCGLDGQEIKKHVGLAMAMGGGVDGLNLAGVLGPRVMPVIVMETITTFNVCHECASADRVGVLDAIGSQWERDRQEKRLATGREEEDAGDAASEE